MDLLAGKLRDGGIAAFLSADTATAKYEAKELRDCVIIGIASVDLVAAMRFLDEVSTLGAFYRDAEHRLVMRMGLLLQDANKVQDRHRLDSAAANPAVGLLRRLFAPRTSALMVEYKERRSAGEFGVEPEGQGDRVHGKALTVYTEGEGTAVSSKV
jgi:hypothetical protein